MLRGAKPEHIELLGDSLGKQLRRRRAELRLRRIDAAPLIGTDEKSLMWWERGVREPSDRFYPGIIRYLGSEPWPEPQTLGERIQAERRRRGLAMVAAAKLMEIDYEVIRRWESGEWKPSSRTRDKLAWFLSGEDA